MRDEARPDESGRGGSRADGSRADGSRADEARLDELRREAAETGRVSGEGVDVAGGPIPAGAAGRLDPEARTPGGSNGASPGYYGRPVLKPPVWTWEIPLYFFVGGVAGASAVIAFAALLAGGSAGLVVGATWVAVAGAVVSSVLLISDLGRPGRFLYMLRVFKWRSPMSVGVWILTKFGGVVTLGAILATWVVDASSPRALWDAGFWGVVLLLCLAGGAVFGALVATYTGVLIGATAVPAWNAHRATLPLHFGVAALGSAAAGLELLGFAPGPLHLLGIAAAGVETLVFAWIEVRRHGARDRALREGRAGILLRGSGALTGPVSLLLRLLGWRSVAAAAFLLGALGSRYGWMEAGKVSARDPEAALHAGG